MCHLYHGGTLKLLTRTAIAAIAWDLSLVYVLIYPAVDLSQITLLLKYKYRQGPGQNRSLLYCSEELAGIS